MPADGFLMLPSPNKLDLYLSQPASSHWGLGSVPQHWQVPIEAGGCAN